MGMLTIRIDDETKMELQEIAKLKNESLSSLTLKAITEMIESEFDYKLAMNAHKRRIDNAKTYPIEDLYQEYDI